MMAEANGLKTFSNCVASTAVAVFLIVTFWPAASHAQVIDQIVEDEENSLVSRRVLASGYELSVSPQLTYTDNARLDPDGEELADGLASVVIEGGFLLDRVNFKGIIDGELTLGAYFDPPTENGEELYEQFVVGQDIRAAGTFQAVKNLLYLDLAALAEQRAIDQRSRFTTDSLAGNDQLANVYSFSVSPYILRQFPNQSSFEARYRFVDVTIDDDNIVDGIDQFLNDSRAHEALVEYSSGRLFDRVAFTLTGAASSIEETGSDALDAIDVDQAYVAGGIRYPLSRKMSVVGTIGYDDIDTNGNELFDDDDLSGAFWKTGFLAEPGRRTSVLLQIGKRFGGLLVEGDGEYVYSSRLRFRGQISRNFSTTTQLQTNGILLLQSQALSFADELRGLQDVTSSQITNRVLQFNRDLQNPSEQSAGLATTNSANFSILANTGRDDFAFQLGLDQSDFGFVTTNSAFFRAAWERQLSRKLNSFALSSYQYSKDDLSGSLDDCIQTLQADPATAGLPLATITTLCQSPENIEGSSHTVSAIAGLGYEFFKDIEGFAQYGRTERIADEDGAEFSENAVTVGLSFDF